MSTELGVPGEGGGVYRDTHRLWRGRSIPNRTGRFRTRDTGEWPPTGWNTANTGFSARPAPSSLHPLVPYLRIINCSSARGYHPNHVSERVVTRDPYIACLQSETKLQKKSISCGGSLGHGAAARDDRE